MSRFKFKYQFINNCDKPECECIIKKLNNKSTVDYLFNDDCLCCCM